ncbi:MAG TPA: hypothetical protein PLP65_07490 [Bacteroidales bacterium]|nr:hypothetical protein [Bacteroidales bacterium]
MKSKIFLISNLLCTLSICYSCQRIIIDEGCDVPIVISNFNCNDNALDSINYQHYDDLTLKLIFKGEYGKGYWCMPIGVIVDSFNSINFISLNDYNNAYSTGDTINEIISNIIYYYGDEKRETISYSFNTIKDFFEAFNNMPPVGDIVFKLGEPPDSMKKIQIKCEIKLSNNKEYECYSKPVKIMP